MKVFCRDGEVRISGKGENDLVTITSDTGTLLYTGFSDIITVDRSNTVIVIQIGSKAFKLAVR